MHVPVVKCIFDIDTLHNIIWDLSMQLNNMAELKKDLNS